MTTPTPEELMHMAERLVPEKLADHQRELMRRVAEGRLSMKDPRLQRIPLDHADALYEAMSYQGFLSPRMADRIRTLCHQDGDFNAAWTMLTDRVRDGLNDTITDGFARVVMSMLQRWRHEVEVRDQRNLDNIRNIVSACQEIAKAYMRAEARGDDVSLLTESIEEMESAVFDLTGKDVFDA